MKNEGISASPRRPSAAAGWLLCLALAALWGFLRLYVFRDAVFPLTYVLPMLVCIWIRNRRMLWTMAAIFVAFATAKMFWIPPQGTPGTYGDWVVYVGTLINIAVGVLAVHVILVLPERLEFSVHKLTEANEQIARQNEELQVQSEELAHQNEEMQAQSEELSQQNEELQAQSEELTQQNEALARSEHELQIREERLRALYEQAAVGIEQLDLDGRLLEGNDMLRRMLGYSREEIRQRTFVQITHPDDWPAEKKLLDQLLAGQIPYYSMEKRYLHKDGRPVWVRVTSSLAKGLTQSDTYRISVIEDITERKRAQAVLRESEQRFRSFVEASAQVVWTVNAAAEVNMAIPAWQAYTGQSEEEARGKGWMNAIHAEDRPRVAEAWQKAIETRGLYEVEYRLRIHDGTWRDILARGVPVKEADGTVQEYIGTCIDITERKKAEDALRESERRFRTLADAMPQLAWIANGDGWIYWYNRRWYEYTGMTPQQMEGWGWQSVHDPEVLPKVLERWKASIATGEPFDMEFPLRGADGKFRPFLTRVQPLKDSEGRVVQWFGTNTDISEQKQVQETLEHFNEELEQRVAERTEQLRTAVEELRRSNEDLEKFAYISSHDLQEPLRMVSNFVGLLARRYQGKLDAKADEYIRFAVDGAQRMSLLIKDLLEYSRVNTRGRELRPTDVRTVVEGVLQGLRLKIEETGARVSYDGLPTVMADETQLAHVFQNLVENALKYRRDGVSPMVDIQAERRDGQWLFRVRDNGLGIDPAYHEQVFAPFKRLHADRGKYPGTGIGLAIVKRIIERHGGQICVQSKGSEGSTFIFTLPA